MSIANPTTYGEWWWAQQVDANKTFADAQEKVLAPYINGLVGLVEDLDGFPPELIAVLKGVGTAGHFGVADVAMGTAGNTAQQGILSGISPLLRAVGYSANMRSQTNLLAAEIVAMLATRRKAIPELWGSRARAEGYSASEAELLYKSKLPFPDILSLMQWARYVTDDTETFTKLQSKQDIPDDEFQIWDFMTQLRLTENEIQSLFTRGYMDEPAALLELRRDGYREFDAQAVLDLAYQIPQATYLIQGALYDGLSDEDIVTAITKSGVHPDFAQAYYTAVLAKPNPSDVIRYMLRTDPDLTELETELRKLGVHKDYMPLFRSLAYPVPPIGDMITMAVREAFTPDIAARFGQYEDYPTELTKYAAMNGISEDWTKRYWAAHWTLPSPQQGFEMFQRGIVTEDELHLLLRALDIMPFWRDKLTQVAYNPLTRIDVRRMFALGVLSEDEVEKAYRNCGYSPEDAKRLRNYVVKATLSSQSGMTVGKIVTAYKQGVSDRTEAYNQILRLGVNPSNVSDVLDAADVQLNWQATKDRITAIGKQYTQSIITEVQAREILGSLRLSFTKVNNLIAKWTTDSLARKTELWTKADVLTMMKRKIISTQRANQELKALGYDAEHINAIIANATYTKVK
jgi:hypothetical protein